MIWHVSVLQFGLPQRRASVIKDLCCQSYSMTYAEKRMPFNHLHTNLQQWSTHNASWKSIVHNRIHTHFCQFLLLLSLSTFFSGDCSSVAKSIPIPAQPYGAVLCTNRVQGTVPTLSTCHPVNMPPCKHASSTSLSGKHTWVFPPGSHGGQLDAESSPRCAPGHCPWFPWRGGGGGDPDR